MKTERQVVYEAIDSERDYQDLASSLSSRPDMLEDFRIGDALSALDFNLRQAKDAWYKDSPPYNATMIYLRKIAGISVKMGETYGMPAR